MENRKEKDGIVKRLAKGIFAALKWIFKKAGMLVLGFGIAAYTCPAEFLLLTLLCITTGTVSFCIGATELKDDTTNIVTVGTLTAGYGMLAVFSGIWTAVAVAGCLLTWLAISDDGKGLKDAGNAPPIDESNGQVKLLGVPREPLLLGPAKQTMEEILSGSDLHID